MFVTGDLHGYEDISKLNSKRFPANKHLTKEDYVIVAGDFGLVWNHQQDELYWRKWLARKNFTTLFIDGNHENFDLLNSYPVEQWNGGKIHKINDSILHLMRGQVFSIHGLKVFTFGGAQSHDKAYRKENVNWWRGEMPTQEEYQEGVDNLARHHWEVDLVITHTCPTSTVTSLKEALGTPVEADELSDYLEHIQQRLTYRSWFFGHFHHDLPLPQNLRLIYHDVEKINWQ